MSQEFPDDPELAMWRAEWQALGGSENFAAQLVVRARKDGRRMRFSAAGEIGAAILATSVCAWLIVKSHGEPEDVVMTVFIVLFLGAWLTQFFTLRAGTFAASGEGVEAFVALTRRRLVTQRRWTRYAERWTALLAVAVVPWAAWVLHGHWAAYAAQPWRGVVGVGGAAVILAGVFRANRVKGRKLAAETEAFERQLVDVRLAR